MEFKDVVHYLLDTDSIMNRWDDSVIMERDELKLDITFTEKNELYCCSFTPFN